MASRAPGRTTRRAESSEGTEEAEVDEEVDPTVSAGEEVCWLDRLCPECGAMPEGEGAEDPRVPCWRCGAVRDQVPPSAPESPGGA